MNAEKLAEIESTRREDLDDRRLRLTIGLFGAILLVAMVLSIELSTMGLTFGSLVYGSNPLWPGHTATFRVGALDARTSRLIAPIRARVVLHDEMAAVAEGEAEGDDVAEITLTLPKELGPRPLLRVELETEQGDDAVEVPLRLADAPTAALRISPHLDALIPGADRSAGPLQIALYPNSGEAVAGLPNEVVGHLTRDGKPVSAAITSKLLGLTSRSDEAGLFSFTFRPPLKPQSLPFVVSEATGAPVTLGVPLDFRPVQLAVGVAPYPVVAPGATIDLRITTLPFRTPLRIDLWAGDVLVQGHSLLPATAS